MKAELYELAQYLAKRNNCSVNDALSDISDVLFAIKNLYHCWKNCADIDGFNFATEVDDCIVAILHVQPCVCADTLLEQCDIDMNEVYSMEENDADF